MKIEYSMPPRCDRCQEDSAECYPPDNLKGYTGLCKDCFLDFNEEVKAAGAKVRKKYAGAIERLK